MCIVFSSHSFWTSSSLDVPAGVTQEDGHTGFFIHLLSAVRALIFLARRIQPFLSLVGREVEFCVLTTLIVLHPLGIIYFFCSFLVRKIPFAGVELTSQRVRGLRGTSELPGRPAVNIITKNRVRNCKLSNFFPVQLTTSRIDNLTRLILTLARCNDHINTRGYNTRAVGRPWNLRRIRSENARRRGGS